MNPKTIKTIDADWSDIILLEYGFIINTKKIELYAFVLTLEAVFIYLSGIYPFIYSSKTMLQSVLPLICALIYKRQNKISLNSLRITLQICESL